MREIYVKSICNLDTISQNNDNAWEKLMAVAEEETGDILFNFKGIEIKNPWNNDKFNEFLKNERVHLKLYFAEETANTIDLVCKLGNLKPGRVINEGVIAKPVVEKVDTGIERLGVELQDYFKINNNVAELELFRRFDQANNVRTVKYIEKAIEILRENNREITEIVINTGRMSVHSQVIELLLYGILEYAKEGLRVTLNSQSKDVSNNINLHRNKIMSKDMGIEDKIKVVKSCVPKLMVGMLARYKRSRAKDEFGRYGGGKLVSNRAAIYRGMTKRNGEVCLGFTTFNGNTFFPRQHWALENDGQILESLDVENLLIPINDVGILDKFMGSRFHFAEPLQYEKEDSITLFDIGNDGKVVRVYATIPMRIKLVLDDWGIGYNKERLEHGIRETNRILGL